MCPGLQGEIPERNREGALACALKFNEHGEYKFGSAVTFGRKSAAKRELSEGQEKVT